MTVEKLLLKTLKQLSKTAEPEFNNIVDTINELIKILESENIIKKNHKYRLTQNDINTLIQKNMNIYYYIEFINTHNSLNHDDFTIKKFCQKQIDKDELFVKTIFENNDPTIGLDKYIEEYEFIKYEKNINDIKKYLLISVERNENKASLTF